MLDRVLNSLAAAGFEQPVIVVGWQGDQIREAAGERGKCIAQVEQLGTGHAAQVAMSSLPAAERILLVHADEPFIQPSVFAEMLDLQTETGAAVVLLTGKVEDTQGLGRVVRGESGQPVALVQESELNVEQQSLREVNLGAYVFDAAFLRAAIQKLQAHPPKGEYYLTDVVTIAAAAGAGVGSVTIQHADDLLGINDLVQLERASTALYRRTNQVLMKQGVAIVDSATTFIEDDVRIGTNTTVHPFTCITGGSVIGDECAIGPAAQISASRIGHRCRILSSTIEESVMEDDVRVGPYAHLRPGTHLESRVEIGNYAEIKNSRIGTRSKVRHVSFIGDATVGKNVNIGAGTVTCNYDGQVKHRTVIEDDVFIGSDTMLRAPVTVGKGAYTGVGSVVTRDVRPGETVAGVPARPFRRSRDGQSVDEAEPIDTRTS